MTVVLASVIAVLGTLGGATATYLFQGKISERAESKARDERLRQERLAAYSSLAGAVMDLRGIQYDRGSSHMIQDDRHSIGRVPRAESSRLRSVAWTAFYRFKLTSPDQRLADLARRAVEEAPTSQTPKTRRSSRSEANGLEESMSSFAPQPPSLRPGKSGRLSAEMRSACVTDNEHEDTVSHTVIGPQSKIVPA